MINRLQNIREIIRKHKLVARYIVTGVSTTLIDIVLLYILTARYGLWYLTSAALALVVSYTTAFVVQKYWTFGDYSEHDLHGQFFRYFLTVLISAVISLAMLSCLVEFAKLNYLFAQLVSLFVAGVFGFIMNVRNVFSRSGDNHGIVIASGIYPPEIGGPASQIAELAKRLADSGVKVAVVTYAKERITDEAGSVDVTRIPAYLPIFLRGPAYLIFLFTGSVKHHTIFAQDVTSTGLPALIVKRILPHKRLVIRIGGDLLWERKVELGETKLALEDYYKSGTHLNQKIFKIGKFIMKSADEIVVPAEYLRQIYIRYYGISESKITVIKNQIPVQRNVALSLEEQKEKTILFAGRFIKLKNVDSLIRAFAAVYEEIKPARLVIVGGGPEKKHYEDLISYISLKDAVIIIDTLPRGELLARINASNLCVCPSLSEVNSNFTLECLSMGKPVLLTRHNGLSVTLPEEMLISPNNQKEIESKLKSLLAGDYNKSELASLVADESRANSWDTIMAQYSKVFQI